MPSRPPRWCARCHLPHSGRCPSQPQRVDRRPDANERGYDHRWQAIRKRKRAADPLCEWCKAKGFAKLADLVDHYIPLRAGGSHDPENLVSMCRRCHGLKTEQDKQRWPELYKN